MSDLFVDRLLDAIAAKGSPICVGIDPMYDQVPEAIAGPTAERNANDPEAAIDAIFDFTTTVLRTVAPHVPIVKFQSAYFENISGKAWRRITVSFRKPRTLACSSSAMSNAATSVPRAPPMPPPIWRIRRSTISRRSSRMRSRSIRCLAWIRSSRSCRSPKTKARGYSCW